MKDVCRMMMGLGCWLLAVGSLAADVLTPEEAAQRVGEEVTFEGEVVAVAASPHSPAIYASFGGAYPRQKLSILFAGEHRQIYYGLPRLNGRTVRVTGTVRKGKPSPVVRVEDSAQIRVMPLTERVALEATGEGEAFFRLMRSSLRDRFKAGDYAALEEVAGRWRRGRERFSDGSLKLSLFYDAMAGLKKPFEEYAAGLGQWQAELPESITARLLLADALVSHAWDARGSGWAYTVTEEGWTLFRERLAQARGVLDALGERRRECPHGDAVLVTIAMGQGWPREEVEELLADAIRREPEYLPTYQRMNLYLQPKWHGQEGDWEAFVRSLPGRLPDGLGEEMMARLVWSLRRDLDPRLKEEEKHFFPDLGIPWEPIRAGFERMRVRYPQSRWVLNAYAVFAGKASDWETLRGLLLELGDDCDMDIWVTWQNVGLARMWADGKPLPETYLSLFR